MTRRAPKTPAPPKAAARSRPTIPAAIAAGREPPAMDLASAVAIEFANAQVNAPVPPSVQAVLDAAPAATAAARADLLARLEEAADQDDTQTGTVDDSDPQTGTVADSDPQTQATDPAAQSPADPAAQT